MILIICVLLLVILLLGMALLAAAEKLSHDTPPDPDEDNWFFQKWSSQ
jgi:hypothetical protein